VTRSRPTAARLAVALAILAAAGCASEAVPTPRPALILPAADERLRDGAIVATSWLDMGSGPIGFNADASFAQPRDAAAALIDALTAHTGSAYETDGLVAEADRELILVSESGFGDDSVAGIQYLLLLEIDGRDWRIDELWTRVTCRRGAHQDVCV
jgi:hypothetical protein